MDQTMRVGVPAQPGLSDIVTAYKDEGFAIVRGVVDHNEAEELQSELRRLWRVDEIAHPDNLRVQLRTGPGGERIVDRLDPVTDLSPPLASLARDRRLTSLAASLIGEEPVLFKDKVIAKVAGTTGYGIHQDYAAWQGLGVPAESIITAVVALDPADRANGCLEIWPRTHGRLLTQQDDPNREEQDDIERADLAPEGPTPIEMDVGDVLLLHPLAVHGSAPNRSQTARRMIFFTYSARRYGDLWSAYYERRRQVQMAQLSDPARRKHL